MQCARIGSWELSVWIFPFIMHPVCTRKRPTTLIPKRKEKVNCLPTYLVYYIHILNLMSLNGCTASSQGRKRSVLNHKIIHVTFFKRCKEFRGIKKLTEFMELEHLLDSAWSSLVVIELKTRVRNYLLIYKTLYNLRKPFREKLGLFDSWKL